MHKKRWGSLDPRYCEVEIRDREIKVNFFSFVVNFPVEPNARQLCVVKPCKQAEFSRGFCRVFFFLLAFCCDYATDPGSLKRGNIGRANYRTDVATLLVGRAEFVERSLLCN